MIIKRTFQIISIFLEFFICQIDRFVQKNKSNQPSDRQIIIIRLDAIGDYILFRNAFHHIKNSTKYKSYKITVIGNIAWKSLSENFDHSLIDKYIWIKPRDLWEKPSYRITILKQLSLLNVEIVFNPTYSRLFNHDSLVKFIKADKKIGVTGDNRNQFNWLFKISNKYYTKLLNINNKIQFEFFRNSEILRKFLEYDVFSLELSLPIKKNNTKSEISVTVFPDAASNYRQWSPKHFARCIETLTKEYNIKIVVLGKNYNISQVLMKELKHVENISDLTGKTTLIDLINHINESYLLLSNDTGVVHIAAALNTPVICISNGNHYKRFVPYPDELNKPVTTIFPKKIITSGKSKEQLISKYRNGSYININSVSPEEVIKELNNFFNKYSK